MLLWEWRHACTTCSLRCPEHRVAVSALVNTVWVSKTVLFTANISPMCQVLVVFPPTDARRLVVTETVKDVDYKRQLHSKRVTFSPLLQFADKHRQVFRKKKIDPDSSERCLYDPELTLSPGEAACSWTPKWRRLCVLELWPPAAARPWRTSCRVPCAARSSPTPWSCAAATASVEPAWTSSGARRHLSVSVPCAGGGVRSPSPRSASYWRTYVRRWRRNRRAWARRRRHPAPPPSC